MKFPIELVWALGGVLVFIVVITRVAFTHRLKRAMGVKRKGTMISADVGGEEGRLYKNKKVIGKPDLVFAAHDVIIVGEYKSRKLFGRVAWREYFQIILYAGLLKEHYKTAKVELRLIYADSAVEVDFDHRIYNALLDLVDEARQGRRAKKAPNPIPLQGRLRLPKKVTYRPISDGNEKIGQRRLENV